MLFRKLSLHYAEKILHHPISYQRANNSWVLKPELALFYQNQIRSINACLAQEYYTAAILHIDDLIKTFEANISDHNEQLVLAEIYANKGLLQLKFSDKLIRAAGINTLAHALSLDPNQTQAKQVLQLMHKEKISWTFKKN